MTIQKVFDAGIQPGTGTYADTWDLPRTALYMKNVGTASAVVKITDMEGDVSEPFTVPAGAPFQVGGPIGPASVRRIEITGNGAQLILYAAWPEEMDPKEFQAQTTLVGTSKVDVVSQEANIALEVGGQLAAIRAQTDKLTFSAQNSLKTVTGA